MQTKWWLDSTTVRGALLASLSGVKQLLDLACLLKYGCVAISNDEINVIVDAVAGLFSMAGVLLVIYGRIKAVLPLRLQRKA